MYKVGDVINALMPYKERFQFKERPVLVLKVIKGEVPVYIACKITKSINNAARNDGLTINKDSDDGKKMRISYDSFIDVKTIARFTSSFIRGKRGYYPNIDLLLELYPLP